MDVSSSLPVSTDNDKQERLPDAQSMHGRGYVLQILKTFFELKSSKIPWKTPSECQKILFRQDSLNINWVNGRF